MIALFFLLSYFLNITAMQLHGIIQIPTHKYTIDNLPQSGTMAYHPIKLELKNCNNLLNCCNTTLYNNSWWKTSFEPACSLYVKQFLDIHNPDNRFIDNNPQALMLGEVNLRLIGLTLKKIILKLYEITYYQTSIARHYHFDPNDTTSQWLRNKKTEIYDAQQEHLPNLRKRFSHRLGPIFFQEIETLIQKFDTIIEEINHSNTGLETTKKELQLFMQSLEQILTKQIRRENELQSQKNLFFTVVRVSLVCACLLGYQHLGK